MSAWAVRTGALSRQLQISKAERDASPPAPAASPEAVHKRELEERDSFLSYMGGTPSYREAPSPTLRRLADD